MQPRKLVLPALLSCALALTCPLLAHAAPTVASAQPAAPPPGVNPAASVAPKPPATPSNPAAPAAKPVVPAARPAAAPANAPPAPATPPSSATNPQLAPAPGVVAPAPAAPGAPPAGKAMAKLPAAKNPVDAAVQQVVMLERAGRPIAIGTLLNGDGRILTALSPLTHGNQIDAHYPEGQIVRVKLSYSSRAWDLALLTPEGDPRRAGLRAARDPAPAAGTKLHAVSYVKDKQLGASEITIKSKTTLRGGDSAVLSDALELPFAPKPNDIGGPLLNDQGEVVAIVARACAANDKNGCTLAAYAAPVSAVRDFLRGVPTRPAPWVGLEGVAFDAGIAHGVRVAALSPGGPAATAGLRAGPPGVGDVILAVDGVPVATSEAFADAIDSHATGPGSRIRLTVLSEGRYRELTLSVDAVPAARHDRSYQSSPGRPWPRAATPNPYR